MKIYLCKSLIVSCVFIFCSQLSYAQDNEANNNDTIINDEEFDSFKPSEEISRDNIISLPSDI